MLRIRAGCVHIDPIRTLDPPPNTWIKGRSFQADSIRNDLPLDETTFCANVRTPVVPDLAAMPDYDLTYVEAAIIDTQSNTLRLLRDVLARLGVKKVELYDSITAAQFLLSGGNPDLVLVDCDGPHEAEAFKFVRAYRNEPTTPNPYAALIVTTWQATQAQVIRMTNSGADDMMVKPVSPKQVMDRLGALIEGRRKFVVTADYVGPDRRKSPREGTQVPLIDPPNTLRMKATGEWTGPETRRLLAEANLLVAEQKRLRASIQIGFLIEFAIPGLARTPVDRLAVEHLIRVPGVVDDLHRRLPDAEASGKLDTACRAMHVLAERVRAQLDEGTVEARDLAHLRTLAHELMQGVDPKRPAAAIEREVQTAVAAYRVRLEAMAQAKADAAKAEAAKADAGR